MSTSPITVRRATVVRAGAVAALAVALAAPGLVLAQAPAARPAPPPPPSALPLTPSKTAKTWTKANRDYATPYKTSMDQYLALKRQAGGGLVNPTPAQLPDWTGIWTAANAVSFDPTVRPRDNPHYGPLSPAYQAQYEKTLSEVAKGVEFDPLSYCLPAGYPRWLSEPFLREFIPTRGQTLLIAEQQDEIRRIYTDGRAHVPEDEAFPLWEGDSIGFWDGDALVIHTTHLKDGDYHRSGPRYSNQATTVEEWRRIDHNTMEVWTTVYDPVGLTKPWHVVRRFTLVTTPGARIDQWVCEENNNVVNQSGVTQFVLPGDPGYKDPSSFGKPKDQ